MVLAVGTLFSLGTTTEIPTMATLSRIAVDAMWNSSLYFISFTPRKYLFINALMFYAEWKHNISFNDIQQILPL